MLQIILLQLIRFYSLLIIVWCIGSWIPTQGGIIEDIKYVLGRLVMPYLQIFSKIIPPVGGIDFSPWVALIVLNAIARFIFRL